MSFNQSSSDKSDSQYRKSGRPGSFNQQRGSSGAYVKGGGGGPAPSPAITSGALQSSNRSFKRSNNPHGGQSRVNPTVRTIPNGAHTQQSPGVSDAPFTNATAKSSEPSSSVQKSTRAVPKAPIPRPTAGNSDAAAPTTPAKVPEGSSKPFAFQFGSINSGFMNGTSIPARTSSASPNLDELKRDQARHGSLRPGPSVPTPPKQLPPRNDGGVTDQTNAGEVHSVNKVKKARARKKKKKVKKEEQASSLPPSSQMQKASVAMTGISMAMPYHHQSQAPVQFSGPNPQIQSQGMPAASLQMPMPMPLPVGNVARVQQQVFVHHGLEPLPIHPPAIMHQNLSFTPQMGHQMPHQLGSVGTNMNSQYSQQQRGKFAGPRKITTFKITHPETHEELRLDFDKKADSHSEVMTPGARSYPNVPSQSQPVQSFAASHPLNYFPSSTYNRRNDGSVTDQSNAGEAYSVYKVIYEEQAKQRRLNAILNKLTPQNFEKLFEQVKAVNIDNAVTLTGAICQIFEKALMKPTFCEVYANLCLHLAAELPEFSEDNEKITFKRLFLNKCQEEFERSEREQEEANKDDEGEVKQSDEEREAKRVKARRRMLGNIRLIGELYKKKMLTERIMHECIKKLLGSYQDPDEEDIEALCELMSTIGEMIDHPKAKEHMDAYFERMKLLSNNMNLSSRVRFILRDAIDLRKNKWQQKWKVEGRNLRQLKAILNMLTPQNFEKLFEQVKAVNIENVVTLTYVTSLIFEKALMEPTFCEMYANLCLHLAAELPDFSEDNENITFKRLLLNKCQEEFERGEREQEEANKDDEGEVKQSDEEREAKRVRARRRMLGNILFIGELYKKKMLTERIMHECIKKLLGSYQDPDEEDIEALCELMSIIGEMIDHPKAKEHMDAYFERMKLLSNNMNLSSRVRFMLRDAIDLRKNKWQQKWKVEGRKKIEEVHRDAAQERQAQTGRLGRGPGNASSRRMAMEFSPRGSSVLSPPNTPMGTRGLSAQGRSGGSQDVRQDDRPSYEARNFSVRLPQSNSSERALYSSREDQMPRYATDRFTSPTAHEQSAVQHRNIDYYDNRELKNAYQSLERPVATSRPGVQGSAVSENAPSEKVWPEERPRDMSMADVTLALTLVRPVPIYNDVALLEKETKVTSSRNVRVPKIFIISKDDDLLTEDFQNWMIQRSLPLDDIKVIEGSDHMVMFSQPTKLASHLLQIADMY
ncbi:hypothetical protein K1719_024201 [Acacia pycnantha]|nr:hypothetical protein K1719_024201 [Acacia pycnantha]